MILYDVVGVGIGIIVVVERVSIVYLFYSIYLGWNEMIRVHRSVETTCVPGGYHEMRRTVYEVENCLFDPTTRRLKTLL